MDTNSKDMVEIYQKEWESVRCEMIDLQKLSNILHATVYCNHCNPF